MSVTHDTHEWSISSSQARKATTREVLKSTSLDSPFLQTINANTDTTNRTAMNQKPVQLTPKIVNLYWAKDSNGTPVEVVDFDSNLDQPIAYAIIQTQNAAWKRYTLVLRSEDHPDITYLRKDFSVKDNGITSIAFTSRELFNGSNHYFVEVWDFSGQLLYSSKMSAKYKEVILNPVKVVPYVMQNLNLPIATTFQNTWFGNSDIRNQIPILDAFTLEWVYANLKNIDGMSEYSQLLSNAMTNPFQWRNDKGKIEIVNSIKGIIRDKVIAPATSINDKVSFDFNGILSTIISHNFKSTNKGSWNVPMFEKYHFQSRQINIPFLVKKDIAVNSRNINDYIAAVGDCNIKWIPSGELVTKGNNSYQFNLKEVGVYIQDWFDFVDDSNSGLQQFIAEKYAGEFGGQPLGSWNPLNRTYGISNGSYAVGNGAYRNYRDRIGMGSDFIFFSKIHVLNCEDSYEFTLH